MHQNESKSPQFIDLVALAAGMLLPFAFAPYHYHLLALLSPTLLLWCWHRASPRRCAWRGFLFGLGFFGVGVSWVYISMHQYAHLSGWQAILLTILFISYLSSLHAIQGYLFSRYYPQNDKAKFLLLYPATWVIVEWLRSTFFSGFPWLLLGFSQTDSALSGIAPILGAPGITFILVACGSFILLFFNWQNRYAYSWLVPVLATWLFSLCLATVNWGKEDSNSIKVALVQGNLTPHIMWSSDNIKRNLQTYIDLSQSLWENQLIVWPENAIPLASDDAADFISSLDEAVKQNHSSLLAGIPMPSTIPGLYHNAIIALGESNGQYYKRTLVPFGEYTPLRRFVGKLLDLLHLPMSNYIPGNFSQPKLNVPGLKIAAYICYEIAFSNTVWHDMPEANIIVTLSNDGWFGHSHAAAQHLQIAQFRSLQTARYQLFAANTGITAIIDSHGKIVKQATPFTATSIDNVVYRHQGYTPWMIWGDYPINLLSLLILILFAWRQRDHAILQSLSSAAQPF